MNDGRPAEPWDPAVFGLRPLGQAAFRRGAHTPGARVAPTRRGALPPSWDPYGETLSVDGLAALSRRLDGRLLDDEGTLPPHGDDEPAFA